MSDAAPYPQAFLIGAGRCGSTLMSNIARAHPALLSVSELFMSLASQAFARPRLSGRAFWRMLSEATHATRAVFTPEHLPGEFLYPYGSASAYDRANVPPLLFVCLPHLTEAHDALYDELAAIIPARPTAALGAHYRYLFDWLAQRFGKAMWLERSGGSLSLLPGLARHFPDAKYVHLIRDGRDVSMSIATHPGMRLFARMWRAHRRIGLDLLRPPLALGANRPAAWFDRNLGGLIPFDRLLAEPLPLADIGRFWSATVEAGLERWAQLPPDRAHEMRYEALIAEPKPILERFARFLDERLVDLDWIERAAAMVAPRPQRWRDLPADERAALEAACAPGLERLGYR